ncbi:MAG TPA: hypothetical protein V6D47_05545 [Oscillatoriaceae cyanobacterium]
MLKRTLIAATAVLALAIAAQAAPEFRDIPSGDWASRPASLLAEANVMPGRTPIDFAGDAALTRYELAHILSQLYTVTGPPSSFIVLADMPPGEAETLSVQRVLGYGLMSMPKPGYFEGDATVSRGNAIQALDNLLHRDGIAPPEHQPHPVYFKDIKPGAPLDHVLDEVTNRYRLIEGKNGTYFFPNQAVTRYQMLGMLVRAMAYLNPTLYTQLTARPTPAPLPSGASPAPVATATPGQAASEAPPATPAPGQSPAPVPSAGASAAPAPSAAPTTPPAPGVIVWPKPPILRDRGWGEGQMVLSYSETLPDDPTLVSASEANSSGFKGSLLAGGDLGAEIWRGLWGGRAQMDLLYVPLNAAINGQTVEDDVIDTMVQGGAYYKFAGDTDWEAAVGPAALLRYAYDMNGDVVNLTYLTADKFYVGAGLSALYGYRTASNFDFTGELTAYPAILETYTLLDNGESFGRWGADAALRGDYDFNPTWYGSVGGHLFLSGGYSGGVQSILGLTVGVGERF